MVVAAGPGERDATARAASGRGAGDRFAAVSAAPRPLRVAFLGCGFIAGVHSRHLRALAGSA